MRNISVLLILLIILGGVVIANVGPEAVEREKAGRVLSLSEVLRIEDGGGGFYFKSPHNIQIAPDGCIFMLDEDQFLKFSPDGRFIKNLCIKGQGPGEFERIKGYVITDDALIVLQIQPNKIVLLTHNGELIREFRPENSAHKLFAVHGGRYVTGRYATPKFDVVAEKPSFMQVEWSLGYISEDGDVEEPDVRFPTRWYAKRLGGRAVIADHISDFIAVPCKNELLILCHTEEYRLKLFDLVQNRVIKEFDRKYRRVRSGGGESGRLEVRPGVFDLVSPVEYVNDIQQVFARNGEIWVMTSTIETRKGVLFDVFNFEGEYIDHFYLPVQSEVRPEGLEDFPLAFEGDSLFITEYTEDGIPAIVKYRIMLPE